MTKTIMRFFEGETELIEEFEIDGSEFIALPSIGHIIWINENGYRIKIIDHGYYYKDIEGSDTPQLIDYMDVICETYDVLEDNIIDDDFDFEGERD